MASELIQALQAAALYDHPVQGFQLVETHISWIILTGDFAYKIKKPVNYGFLDFSSLERRRHFCEKELELNRRLAPQLYLAVLPITGSPSHPTLNGAGEAIEYAIQMRQFDQDQLLDRLQARGELTLGHILELTDRIADFHQRIAATSADAELGQPDQVFQAVQQNFDQIGPRLHTAADRAQLAQLEAWAHDTFERIRPVLAQRKAGGFIRECHGDLHLGNITRIDGTVTPFDCIEFNDAYRWIDVLSDVAFLLMDLEDRSLDGFANHALNRYLEQTGDYAGLAVLKFYKSYRAMVRAKVALLTQTAPDINEAGRAECLAKYRSYADLAESYTFVPNRCLLITHGVSGSGKSTLSHALTGRLGLIRLRSDVERKRLHGMTALARSRSEPNGGIYTADATTATYERLADLARQLLASGHAVVVDATFLQHGQRALMEKVAEEQGVPFVILACEADPTNIRRWIRQREASQTDASEAGLQVLERQLAQREPLIDDELAHRLEAHTDQPETLEPLLRSLGRRLGRPLIPH